MPEFTQDINEEKNEDTNEEPKEESKEEKDSFQEEYRRQLTYMQLMRQQCVLNQRLNDIYMNRTPVQRFSHALKQFIEVMQKEKPMEKQRQLRSIDPKFLPPERMDMPLSEEALCAVKAFILQDHWKKHPEAIRELTEERIGYMMEDFDSLIAHANENELFRKSLRGFMCGTEACPAEFLADGSLCLKVQAKELSLRKKEPFPQKEGVPLQQETHPRQKEISPIQKGTKKSSIRHTEKFD
ncbi:MAG: hypothetical protein Q4C63_03135 [Eubacteriales bacterium]|nr:hypothetical protein [Eubacteriales bacterium]